jgi:hypothetical protein
VKKSEFTAARPGSGVPAANTTLAWEIATVAIDSFGSGDHGDLMVFVSGQIKVQGRAA